MNAPLIFTVDVCCTHCGGPANYLYVQVVRSAYFGAGDMKAWCPACNVEIKTPDTPPPAPRPEP